jgi:Putative Flp pilus-assembly TadE/G-like
MNREKGQVFPLTALMLVVLIGAAALAIDVSTSLNQQRRQQGDLDTVTKLAAGQLATGNYTYYQVRSQASSFLQQRGYDTSPSALMLTTTVTSAPYAGRTGYVEGSLNQNLRSFFGRVLGFGWMHVSVHAVAEGGGSIGHTQFPSVLGLDPNGCALSLNSGSATVSITSTIGLNSAPCLANGSATLITSTAPLVDDCPSVSCFTDPFGPSGPVTPSIGAPITVGCTILSCSNNHNNFLWLSPTCLLSYESKGYLPLSGTPANNTIYEFPRDATDVVDGAISSNSSIKGYVFLPYCSGLNSFSPGIYSIPSVSLSSQVTLTTYDSTLVFASGVSFINTASVTWDLNPPDSGIFYDAPFSEAIALYQPQTSPCPTPNPTFSFSGSVSVSAKGIIDLPCADIHLTGNSVTGFGAMAVWQITDTGNATSYITPIAPEDVAVNPRGAVLVE